MTTLIEVRELDPKGPSVLGDLIATLTTEAEIDPDRFLREAKIDVEFPDDFVGSETPRYVVLYTDRRYLGMAVLWNDELRRVP